MDRLVRLGTHSAGTGTSRADLLCAYPSASATHSSETKPVGAPAAAGWASNSGRLVCDGQ